MTITPNKNGSNLVLQIQGRLDTTTAPELESVINSELTDVTDLVMDCAGLEYVSSAGLRVFLRASKLMQNKGSMKLINVDELVMEVFEITGFSDILTIE